ncbi:RxLR effector protein, partial [Phytophthora megakarya]
MASPRRITCIVALIMALLVSSVTAQLDQNMEMVEIPKAQSTGATGEAKTTIRSLRSGGDFAAEVSHKEERLSNDLRLLWLGYMHKYRTTMSAANNDVLDIVKAA